MAIHKLYGELAASLVRGCWRSGGILPRAGTGLGGSGGLSAFEGAYRILRLLEVTTVDEKLAVDGEQVLQFVTGQSRAGQLALPPIDDVLEAWIQLAQQKGYASLKRLPFVPHDDVGPVMDALVGLGYAARHGNTFLWTDRIARAMQMSGWWDEHGFSRDESDERGVDLEMRAALDSIPEDVRLAALRDDRAAVAKALAARWAGGAWLTDAIDDAPWWRWAALGSEANCLVELVQGPGDLRTLDIS